MKLAAQVLALCTAGCAAHAAAPVYPVHPTEPVGDHEISDPRLLAEEEPAVLEPLPAETPIVATPVRDPVPLFRLRSLLPPPPPPEHLCISCGMG